MLDVAIVGAGLSGLSAASLLIQNDVKNIRVLEARDRVGGRTHSQDVNGRVLDLGAQWIGPHQKHILKAVAKTGVHLYPQYNDGKKIVDIDGACNHYNGPVPHTSWINAIDIATMIARLDLTSWLISADYARISDNTWMDNTLSSSNTKHVLTRSARILHNLACRVIWGVDDDQISQLHFFSYCRSSNGLENIIDGNQKWKVIEGTQSISKGLANIVSYNNICLGTVVTQVKWNGDYVEIHDSKGNVTTSKSVIFALPIPLLRDITFVPPLPPEKTALFNSCFMGSLIKINIRYAEPFWRHAGLCGEILTDSFPANFFYDHCDENGDGAAIVAFIGGNAARDVANINPEERKQLVLHQFYRFSKDAKALEPMQYIECNWQQEEFTRGGPVTNFPLNTLSQYGSILREPVGRVMFWAGTDTAIHGRGFMDGAVEAGERAATEVLNLIKGDVVMPNKKGDKKQCFLWNAIIILGISLSLSYFIKHRK